MDEALTIVPHCYPIAMVALAKPAAENDEPGDGPFAGSQNSQSPSAPSSNQHIVPTRRSHEHLPSSC
jgi:hypothetical protein